MGKTRIMLQALENVKVVLVNPLDSRNIGSVCRAMKSMGLRKLAIVGGNPVDYDLAGVLAVHAEDVLEQARFFADLDAALSDTVLSAGITRRRGKRRKYFSVLPEELADRIALIREGPTAVVFGNEESGLTDDELSHCTLAVRIPSSELFPSLNLSHAVQIIAYQIFRRLNNAAAPRYTPISREKMDHLISIILASLGNLGFFRQVTSRDMGIFLRDILSRSGLSGREAKRLETLFRKISGMAMGRGIGGRGNSP
jgi:TrmH family RNA methyltransferase